jgi:acyl-CoA-binding protein
MDSFRGHVLQAPIVPHPRVTSFMSDDLQSQFEQASLDITRLGHRPDNDTLLRIYALYKQGSEGDFHGEKPGFFDFVGTAKYEAWAKLAGTPRDAAMHQYIDLVRSLGG